MASRLILISLLSLLCLLVSAVESECPDFVKDRTSKQTCTSDWQCLSLCCDSGKCNTGTCSKAEQDECPTWVEAAEAEEKDRFAREKEAQDAADEKRKKFLMSILIPIGSICFLCCLCTGLCAYGVSKYLKHEKEKKELA